MKLLLSGAVTTYNSQWCRVEAKLFDLSNGRLVARTQLLHLLRTHPFDAVITHSRMCKCSTQVNRAEAKSLGRGNDLGRAKGTLKRTPLHWVTIPAIHHTPDVAEVDAHLQR